MAFDLTFLAAVNFKVSFWQQGNLEMAFNLNLPVAINFKVSYWLFMLRLEVLAVQYDTDKKDKLEKWETWKVKLRSILALKRNHLNEIKAEDPTHENMEELLAKAKVKRNITKRPNK